MTSDPYASDVLAGVDVQQAAAEVADTGVFIPSGFDDADAAEGLRAVVQDAHGAGLDLSIVVVPNDQWGRKLNSFVAYPERLRNLSTAVGESDGGTVVALSPGQIGSYSDTLSRFTLESAENAVQNPRPPELTTTAARFAGELEQDNHIPWTAISAVLLVVVVLVVAGGTAWNVRRTRA